MMELELKRIADSLETIVGLLKGVKDGGVTANVVTADAAPKRTKKTPKTPAAEVPMAPPDPAPIAPQAQEEEIPGQEAVGQLGMDTSVFDNDPAPVAQNRVTITNAESLRLFAQKCLPSLPQELSQKFFAYVRNDICGKFSPKEPKLIKLQDKDAQEAANMIVKFFDDNKQQLPK